MTEQNAIANYLKYTGNKSIDIKVALIDMDGVLYDSMKNHTRAWVKLMTKNGIKCTRDEFYMYEGMTGEAIIKQIFKRGSGKNITDDEAKALYGVKARYFHELGEVGKIAGADQMLAALKQAGLECVLVTGSGQKSILDRIDAKAEAKANQCIVVENAPLGVQAGHAAGCFTVGVTTGPIPEKDLYKAGADIVYADMNAFAQALPGLIEQFKATQQ